VNRELSLNNGFTRELNEREESTFRPPGDGAQVWERAFVTRDDRLALLKTKSFGHLEMRARLEWLRKASDRHLALDLGEKVTVQTEKAVLGLGLFELFEDHPGDCISVCFMPHRVSRRIGIVRGVGNRLLVQRKE
jgi:hypothetical protein